MTEEDREFETDDMALAVVLSIAGFLYTLKRRPRNHNRGVWVFCPVSQRGEEFDDLVEEYDAGATLVEPKSFALEWARVRKAMLDFIYGQPCPRSDV